MNVALENNKQEIAATNYTKQIFESIGLKSVYWIDDQFRKDKADSHQEQECIDQLMAKFNANDFDYINSFLQNTLGDNELHVDENLPGKEFELHIKEKITDGNVQDVVKALEIKVDLSKSEFETLQKILGQSIEKVHFFSWKDWQNNKDILIKSPKSFIIVDQKFADEVDAIGNGDDIIEILTKNMPNSSYCFLLTHEAKDHQGENNLRETIISNKKLPPKSQARFSVVAKNNLVSGEESLTDIKLSEIARSVYLRRINVDTYDLIRKQLNQQLNELRDDLCQSSAFEIEQIVFNRTREEGSCEIDLLRRFINIKSDLAITKSFTTNSHLLKKLAKIRKIQSVGISDKTNIDSLAKNPIEKFTEYRELELFDTSINKLHSPLSVGDIFNFGTEQNPKLFILISQECDLAIRDNKPRKAKEVYLIPISIKDIRTLEKLYQEVQGKNKDDFSEKVNAFMGHQYHYLLRIIDNNSHKQMQFKLNEAIAVNVEILDLCVYNSDGALTLKKNLKPACISPLIHLPGWKKKLELTINSLNAANDGELPAEFIHSSFNQDKKFKINIDNNGGISLKGKRVKRLKAPYKNELIHKFYAYKSRSAFEHDFTED